ncbi:hypothetical protein NSP_29720 [Nodularia spumigena CCY9414]|nr:hypothetical protein NSP_29720 [Nodularia spumigena CCY9414]
MNTARLSRIYAAIAPKKGSASSKLNLSNTTSLLSIYI